MGPGDSAREGVPSISYYGGGDGDGDGGGDGNGTSTHVEWHMGPGDSAWVRVPSSTYDKKERPQTYLILAMFDADGAGRERLVLQETSSGSSDNQDMNPEGCATDAKSIYTHS